MEQDGQPTVYYHYDARNAMTQVDRAGGTATEMEYDAAGNLVKETEDADETYYVWNADGLMERADLPSGLSNYFEYDGDDRRWQKQDSDGTKRYRWDAGRDGRPSLAVVQEADETDATVADYTHDQGVTIMPGVGTILSVHEDSSSHFFHTDAQGTTRTVTDSSEATDATYDLDAFGVLRSQTGTFSTPYLYTGKERDPNPNLDYFIARQYAVPLGVFVSKDPLGPSEGWYLYVGASPLVKWDPRGQATTCDELKDLAALVALELPGEEGRKDKVRFYHAMIDYMYWSGYTLTARMFRHWLAGSGADVTMPLSRLLPDRGIGDQLDDIRRFLRRRVQVLNCCCGSASHEWETSLWPSTTDNQGAMGYIQVRARLTCQAGMGAHAGWCSLLRITNLRCELEWDLWKEWDFDQGTDANVGCLPRCNVGMPIMDQWAFDISYWTDPNTGTEYGDGPARFYRVDVEMDTESFTMDCPHIRTVGARGPKAPRVGPPEDWPGPFNPKCWLRMVGR
ncbi:MAG: hypothetical protein GF320_11270 [Armatimonadia bacterium]|nr:hypothetical protein [Armatimonadia bacterium]